MKRFISLLFCVIVTGGLRAEEAAKPEVFSGPQSGERLASFKARYAYGKQAGEEFDPVADADGKPILLIFVHKVTRPAIGLTRVIANYASRYKDKMHCSVVFLTSDASETDSWLRRIQNGAALPKGVHIGVYLEGAEGPGAYGLNRQLMMTALVGKESKVAANFALSQPNLTDAPKIGLAIEQALGSDKQPTLAQMGGDRAMRMRRAGGVDDGKYRALMGPVIQKTATKEEVDAAAKKVESFAAENAAFKTRVADAANRIINSGKLENYGTPHAQSYLKKWAKEFGAKE